MAWIKAGVETKYEGTDENRDTYGTRTPNVSDRYTGAFETYRNSLNPNGYNVNQQGAVDYTQGYLSRGGSAGRIAPVNASLEGIRTGLGRYTTATPNLLGRAPTATAGTAVAGTATAGTATAGRAVANTIDGVDPIVAQQIAARRGSEFRGDYMDPYIDEVVDASLADYDNGVAEGYTALRAASPAFANKRLGVAEGQFFNGAVRGRASLSSGLRSDAFRFGSEYGARDADRFLGADVANQDASLRAATANADNLLRSRTFNAGALNEVSLANANNDTSTSIANAGNQTSTSVANANNQTSVSTTNANNETGVSRTNADIVNTRDIADQGSRNTADTNAITALSEQAGITNDIAANIFKADGIDLQAAENLFSAGTISQDQLNTIIAAARDYNGFSYSENENTNKDVYGVNGAAGIGL